MAGALNVPAYNTDNLSFGPGIVYIGASGTTPATDVGLVASGAQLQVTGSNIDVRAGSPQVLVKRFRQVSDVTFSFTSQEWNYENLRRALGAGTTTSTTYDYGADPLYTEFAIQFVHRMPSGTTQYLRLWSVVPDGELTINFGDDLAEFPQAFTCLAVSADWAGNTLSGGYKYFRVKKIVHP